MLQDLLVVTTHGRGDQSALAAGIALAGSEGAHLAVLVCVPLTVPVAFELNPVPPDFYAQLQQAERERGEQTATEIRRRLAQSGAPGEVRVVETRFSPPASIAALHARHADLAIVGGVTDESSLWADSVFLELLTDSGRPVLVVPPQHEMQAPIRHVVVAWQPTREAARAVHDSLPLLQRAQSVDVLVVDPAVDETRHGEEPGADLATHLARHGVRVRVVARPLAGESAATVISRHAVETGAGLIVAGGYSHSRLRQKLFGGVTRSLLESCPVPVLLSH